MGWEKGGEEGVEGSVHAIDESYETGRGGGDDTCERELE